MIEIVSSDRCIACDICVRVCPANVFEAVKRMPPVIVRQSDCQTCFLCEIYCPTDALYVAPCAEGPTGVDEAQVEAAGLFGSYSRALGWRRGKPDGSVIQSVGELCLSPIGLSMVTKLAPARLVGFGMGGWFLSTGIGNNLSGIFASHVSGESGMDTASALSGYTFGFWALMIPGVLLFLIAPLIQRLMHGVK